jgi:hypothetical protein
VKPIKVINIIAEKFGIEDISEIMHRWKRGTMKFRSVVAYALTTFCGMEYRDVNKYICNVTNSSCARLSNKGFDILKERKDILDCIVISA